MEDKKFDTLYEKANTFLKKQNSSNGAQSIDVMRIMEEINTYRIELDMQNDELQKNQSELKELKDKYVNLYNLLPIAYLTIDKDDTILEANMSSIKLFGVKNNMKGLILSKFIMSKSQDIFYLHKQKVFETMKKQVCTVKFHRTDGTKFKALLQSIAVQEKKTKSINIVIIDIVDIPK